MLVVLSFKIILFLAHCLLAGGGIDSGQVTVVRPALAAGIKVSPLRSLLA